VTLEQALAPGAPLVHDIAAQNTLIDARFETADIAASFATAQRSVFRADRQGKAALREGSQPGVDDMKETISRERYPAIPCSSRSAEKTSSCKARPRTRWQLLGASVGGEPIAMPAGIAVKERHGRCGRDGSPSWRLSHVLLVESRGFEPPAPAPKAALALGGGASLAITSAALSARPTLTRNPRAGIRVLFAQHPERSVHSTRALCPPYRSSAVRALMVICSLLQCAPGIKRSSTAMPPGSTEV
jgi:hypothetical protein